MLPPALQDLVRSLDATRDPTPQTLGVALNRPIGIDDVASFIRFDSANYVRNLVHRRRHFELPLLCWRPGKTSSLHAHGAAACAFRILAGSATETILGAHDRKWPPATS